MPGIYDQLAQGMLTGMQPQGGMGGAFGGPGGGGPMGLMAGAGPRGLHPSMPFTMGGTAPPGFEPHSSLPNSPMTGGAPNVVQSMGMVRQATEPSFADRFAQHLNNPLVAAGLGFGTSAMGRRSLGEGIAAGLGGGLAGFQGAYAEQERRKKKDPRMDMMRRLIASYGGVADEFSASNPKNASPGPGSAPVAQPTTVGSGVFDSGAQRLNTYSGLY